MIARRSALLLVAGLATIACTGADSAASPASGGNSTSPATAPPTSSEPPATAAPVVPVTTDAPTATAATDGSGSAPVGTGYDFGAVSAIVEDFVDDRDLSGAGLIVVDRDAGVIHHEHWGEFSEDRISLVASSSKMITAGVLLRLHDEGLLDIDAPIADVVAWGAGNPDVTPAQLLANSSGLVGLANPGYAPYLCQFVNSGSLQECAEAIFTTPDDDADVIPPDTAFRYGGAQWQVAGAVAEAASGMPWAQLVDEIYVEPCGLDSLGYNNHFLPLGAFGFVYPEAFENDPAQLPPTDNPNMEGGAYVTTGDYGKLLLMHLRGGRCGDTQVLSQESLDRMHADRVAATYGGEAFPGLGYGMGWWVDRSTGRISDSGAYGSVPWLDLDDGYGAFLVMEADGGTGNSLAELLYAPIHEAVIAGRS